MPWDKTNYDDMKLTILRTDKKGVLHLSAKSAEKFFERIKTDTKAGDIGRLREYIATFGDTGGFEQNVPIARIYPSAEMVKTENGNLQIKTFNGLIWLHVAELMTPKDIEAVKKATQILPMTYAAFTGGDGRSVEILVSAAANDPQAMPQTEQEMDGFCRIAYDSAFNIYNGVLPKPIERQVATAKSGFRMTLDEKPYFNPKATPLTVQMESAFKQSSIIGTPYMKEEAVTEQREVNMDLYAVYEQMYKRASEEAFEVTENLKDSEFEEAYLTELARRLCIMNVSEEETFLHIRNHRVYKMTYNEDILRAIVSAVYTEERPKSKGKGEEETVSQETSRLINHLKSRYVFRYNTVMGYTEYRPNNTWIQEWTPCDENVINGMTLEARLANLDVRDKDVRRYVHSNLIRKSDPISDFILSASNAWDGKTDHIAMLARCVPCDIPQWEQWFKKWFVAMVAQWILPQQEYGNSVVPLLISPQGDGKTTFCRMILPKELRWGFLENLDVSEKRQTLQAMHNFLLINLDEFNQISPKLQEGFLKNVIQLPSVKIKRPYGKHVEEFKRYASFIATTNEVSVLNDPTGSRRFICVNLTAPIKTDYKPNYKALYGQAYKLVTQRQTDWWFNADEVKEIMAHNAMYQQIPPAIQYFCEYFEPAENEEEGEWMSPTAIYESLRQIPGSGLKVNGVSNFGKYLYNMPNLRQDRNKKGRFYLVKKVK